MKIYNSLTHKKEDFVPITPQKVKMYACGITVYDQSHIGHAMQAIFFDVIRRYFEYLGHEVTYVRNYTDVDDKIIAKAKQTGQTALEVSAHFIEDSKQDMALIKVRPATVEPKVSEHIDTIIEFIEGLIAKGFAYQSGSEVFFEVAKFPAYGCLSGRNPDELLADETIACGKRSPHDFSLWKPAKEGEPFWPSPWGNGRPGWHIECSAMANKYLGKTIDIHGGGLDIIFPHHENEVAQSEALNSCRFANYWIHNGLVMVDNQKMSKSLNNFLSIKDALKSYQPDVLRFMILSFSIASNVNFTEQNLHAANRKLFEYYQILAKADQFLENNPEQPNEETGPACISTIEQQFREAMDDFFNTAKVLSYFPQAFKELNDAIVSKKLDNAAKKAVILNFKKHFKPVSDVLGILDENPAVYIKTVTDKYIKDKNLDVKLISEKIAERNEARKNKDFAKSDEIRNTLGAMGVCLQDAQDKTTWSIIL